MPSISRFSILINPSWSLVSLIFPSFEDNEAVIPILAVFILVIISVGSSPTNYEVMDAVPPFPVILKVQLP